MSYPNKKTAWDKYNGIQYWSSARHREQIKKLIARSLFTNQIKPFVLLGNISGSILFRITDNGSECKLWSRLVLWSTFAFTVSTIFMGLVTMDMVTYFYASKRFEEKMYAQIFIVVIIPYSMIPITLWQDSRTASQYYNNWTEFQVDFYEVTGKILELNVERDILLSLIMCVLKSTLPCLGMLYLPPYLELWQMPLPVLSILLQSNLLFFWVLTCKAVYTAGEKLAERFKHDMKRKPCRKRIAEYRCIWLQMSRLCSETGYCAFRTYGVYMTFSLWIITSGLYGLIWSLAEYDFFRTLPFFFITVDNTYTFFLICNGGYLIHKKVEESMKHELQKVTPSTVDVAVWQEVDAFLKTIANNPPIITLGGFINLDRHLCQSAAATVVTYLIVLLQFKLTLPDAQLYNQNFNTSDVMR